MEILPSYTPEVLPGYDLTPTTSIAPSTRPSSPVSFLARARAHPNYVLRSERMELDLGPRRWGTRLPTYGRSGQVQGILKVNSFKHVDKIVVRLIGKLNTSQVMNQIPTFSQSHAIVHKPVELWSSGAASSSDNTFSFSFDLQRDEGELPPSATIQLRRGQANVAYAVRVDMYRKGMHMHETLQSEILYLPRTTTPYCRPFVPASNNEKRPQITPGEWHTVPLQHESTKPGPSSEKAPEILLPQSLTYPSGYTIPFIISSLSGVADVQLVRVSTIQTRTGVVQQASTVAHGRVTSEHGDRIHGEIETGEAEKEHSWGFEKLAGVSYEMRVVVPSTSGTAWKLTQEVTLTTHGWSGSTSCGLPSLGSSVASRTAVNLINMNI